MVIVNSVILLIWFMSTLVNSLLTEISILNHETNTRQCFMCLSVFRLRMLAQPHHHVIVAVFAVYHFSFL